MTHIYGIPNCDTIKKSLDWFKKNKVEFTFHDFRKDGIAIAKLKTWSKAVGRDVLLNKKSTTWRELSPEEQEAASTDKGGLALMQEKTTVIKRPVVEWANGNITAGFNEASFIKNSTN